MHWWEHLSSIPGLSIIDGLSSLLVLVFALRGFSPGSPVFSSPTPHSTLPNSNSICMQWMRRASMWMSTAKPDLLLPNLIT